MASISENKNILIWRIVEFNLAMSQIWRLRVNLILLIDHEGSGLLQLPSIEQYGVATANEGIVFSGVFGLQSLARESGPEIILHFPAKFSGYTVDLVYSLIRPA